MNFERIKILACSLTVCTALFCGNVSADTHAPPVQDANVLRATLDNGLRGDITLLATKSLLDGVASIAFAAALGPGVYLAAATVLVVQGGIAGFAFLLTDVMDAATVVAITATGGIILLGVALRLLELKQVRVANFLPALLLAPLFLRVADWIRQVLP